MRTLVLDRRNSRLSLDGRRLRIEVPDSPPRFVPIGAIERVVIGAFTGLDSRVLSALAEAGASLLVLSPRDHHRTALLLPPSSGDHAARLAQYAAANRPGIAAEIAARIVRMKLAAQRRTLARLVPAPVSHDFAAKVREWRRELRETPDLSRIRGIEGAAASMYFGALPAAFPDSLGFAGRRRRPAPDPVNAMLSLGYTLAHADAVRALHATGLDPAIGFLHAPAYNRESLACDLIEPLRPRVDAWVHSLFRARTLRADHFARHEGACRLGKAGRRVFYQAWERVAPGWRRSLARGAVVLKRALAAQ